MHPVPPSAFSYRPGSLTRQGAFPGHDRPNGKPNGTPRAAWVLALGVVWSSVLFAPSAVYAGCPPITPSPFWRNTVDYPNDPFRVPGTSPSDPGWIKFTILTCDPTVVYFQDSIAYSFHYHFAVARLDPFFGMTNIQFDAVTLHLAGQQAVLGAIILPAVSGFPPPPAPPEYGIQFVGLDAYPREMIRDLFNVVRGAVNAGPEVQAFYFPSFEQQGVAQEHAAWFASEGIPVSSPARWATGNASYSDGWTLGRLKFVPANQIQQAFLNGTLLSNDVLLTDGVPAEIPILAGVISLSPATPNSHVAILARTFRIPFVYLAVAADVARAQTLVGHEIVLRADRPFGLPRVKLIDVEGKLSGEQRDRLLDLLAPPPLQIEPMAPYGSYTANTASMVPSDIRFFGGKAANFGYLRTAIPNNSPVAMAFSFNLWNEYLDQTLSNGVTLRQEIANRLAPFAYPPSDMAALSSTLAGIRDLFRNNALSSFSPALQNVIITALQDPQYNFDPLRNIRFRSSTNVEDSAHFTGAGLYESFSGCLADELDGDTQGPSICDPTENNERGVFRAIRRVFGSFYNDNAYLERLRHNVNENQVGMAILVHHSFPDEFEDANGVGTLDSTGNFGLALDLVTQDGAHSVTNPEPGTIAEVVHVDKLFGTFYLSLLQYSNLVPLGMTVMDYEADYVALSQLCELVANRFALVTGRTDFVLDFEYKKDLPTGNLIIKQVRELPQPDGGGPSIVPLLVNEPAQLEVLQGEGAGVFTAHRMKTRLALETHTVDLSSAFVSAQSIFSNVSFEYIDGCRTETLNGTMAGLPGAQHSFENGQSTDAWRIADLPNPRTYELSVYPVPTLVPPLQCPVLTLSDLGAGVIFLKATYDTPVITIDPISGTPVLVAHETVAVTRPFPQVANDILVFRDISGGGGVSVHTEFYWPPPPPIVGGYTAPLARFLETEITGLTNEPIVLHSLYSQTYMPHHHNFGEEFIFDPWLEPGLSPDILQALLDQNVRLLHVWTDFLGGPAIVVYSPMQFGEPACDPCVWRTGGDMNGDGLVNGADISQFVGVVVNGWTTVTQRCGADVNRDQTVNFADVQAMTNRLLQ